MRWWRRAVRTQKFLRVTEADLRKRQQQHDEAIAAASADHAAKVLTKEQMEAFVDRLAQDATRRDDNRWLAVNQEPFAVCLLKLHVKGWNEVLVPSIESAALHAAPCTHGPCQPDERTMLYCRAALKAEAEGTVV